MQAMTVQKRTEDEAGHTFFRNRGLFNIQKLFHVSINCYSRQKLITSQLLIFNLIIQKSSMLTNQVKHYIQVSIMQGSHMDR